VSALAAEVERIETTPCASCAYAWRGVRPAAELTSEANERLPVRETTTFVCVLAANGCATSTTSVAAKPPTMAEHSETALVRRILASNVESVRTLWRCTLKTQ
jgi:hypothetical protein